MIYGIWVSGGVWENYYFDMLLTVQLIKQTKIMQNYQYIFSPSIAHSLLFASSDCSVARCHWDIIAEVLY